MKAQILSQTGKTGAVELPEFFSERIRDDIAQKFYEAEKRIQPYGPYVEAGKQHSASGNIRHGRRKWKTSYGHGISRVPRKIFWRRGDHFYWQGAEISSARGGRAAHPPKVAHFLKERKINKKEAERALKSAIISTASLEMLKRRYETLRDREIELNLPIIIKGELLKLSSKEFFNFLKRILNGAIEIALQNRNVRAGKGKRRGRKYKKTAGLLLITGKDEKAKFQGIKIRKLDELEISDLWPLGRLTIYTENAIKQLSEVK